MISEVREAVGEYLALMEAPASSPQVEHALLLSALMRLEVVGRKCIGLDGLPAADAPSKPLSDFLLLARNRFPWMGYYNLPDSVTDLSAPAELDVGDAHDDVGDIHHDLWQLRWHLEHSTDPEVLALVGFGWQYHWGEHLTNLRWYLFHLENESV